MTNPSRVFETEVQTTFDGSPIDDDSCLPGPLRGTVTLILHTAFAQRLVNGRPGAPERSGILGLFGFAQLLRRIWHAAEEADPYADWWLLKTERALSQAEFELQGSNSTVLARLSGLEALVIEPATSVRPVRTSLNFSSAQAFRGAQLIARCDAVARAVLTARYVGCMPAQTAASSLWKLGHAVRSAFGIVRGYTPTGVTRPDLINATPRAAHAIQQMGLLPEVILEESVMPENRPRRQAMPLVEEIVATPLASPEVETGDLWPDHNTETQVPDFEDDLIDLLPGHDESDE